MVILCFPIMSRTSLGTNLSYSYTNTAASMIHWPYKAPHTALPHPVSATVQCIPSGSTWCQCLAVMMCPREYVWSWRTIFGLLEVPEVKYIIMGSEALVSLLSKLSEAFSTSASKSSHPSRGAPESILTFREGMSSAASTAPLMLDWSVHMTALTSADLILYSMSCLVSMWVAGATIAPSLWRATMEYQNWYFCFRMSMTTSPLPIPCAARQFAVLSLILLMSAKVNLCSSPETLSHTRATRSGSFSAMSSTMSYPKL